MLGGRSHSVFGCRRLAAFVQAVESELAEWFENAVARSRRIDHGHHRLVDEAEDVDDSDLDDQTYSDVDDDFRPSEEIPADQSIAFPTDI